MGFLIDGWSDLPPPPVVSPLDRLRVRPKLPPLPKDAPPHKRAEWLLQSVLYPCQYEEWCQQRWFSIRAGNGRLYAFNGNVNSDNVTDGTHVWCAYPQGGLPVADWAAAAAMVLATRHKYFFAIAVRGAPMSWRYLRDPHDYGGII